MAKRTKALTRDLHARGLRKKLARHVARLIAAPGAPAERLAVADSPARSPRDPGARRSLAQHAEPHASAPAAASRASNGDTIPPHRVARPRARRN